jgi:hypothetical protein
MKKIMEKLNKSTREILENDVGIGRVLVKFSPAGLKSPEFQL